MAAIAWETLPHYLNCEVERKEKKQVRNLTKPENAHEKYMVSRAKNLSAQNMLLYGYHFEEFTLFPKLFSFKTGSANWQNATKKFFSCSTTLQKWNVFS